MIAKMDRLMVFGFEIHHSLLRSDNRKDVLIFMKKQSERVLYKETIYRISIDLDMSPANIRGVILGNGSRYKKDYSLVSLGLIGYEKKGRFTVYFLTPKGFDVARILEELA